MNTFKCLSLAAAIAVVATLVAASALGASAQEASTYRVSIVNPADQSTVFSDTGEMTVQASVSPALANGDSLELLVDGQSAGPPGISLDFALSGMARGEHLIQARVIDATGNVAVASPPDTFQVWTASILLENVGAGGPGP
jgi:ABC-type glycerol-3-phosphate transport system substrate-binding protein